MHNGDEFDLQLHLLDRQIEDCDGMLIAKVDDVQFRVDGTDLYVDQLLVGARARSRRMPGRIGTIEAGLAGRLADGPVPGVGFASVRRMGSGIELTPSADVPGLTTAEDWVREHIIARIPGSKHESE